MWANPICSGIELVLFAASLTTLTPTVLNFRPAAITRMQASSREIVFKSLSAGSGKRRDGTPFSFALYESSDHIGVSATTEKYRSSVAAKRELRRKLDHATKLIESGPKLNEDGRRVGERVVAMFAPEGTAMAQATVLWTDGPDFHYIQSPSLPHALKFEKKYYR